MTILYWKSGASGNASVEANWNDAVDGSGTDKVPAAGDSVVLQQGGDCEWNLNIDYISNFTVADTFTGTLRFTGSSKIGTLIINANGVSFTTTSTTTLSSVFTVAAGVTVACTTSNRIFCFAGCTVTINGQIIGSGNFCYYTYNSVHAVKLKNINCKTIQIENLSSSPGNYGLSIYEDVDTTAAIVITDKHATNTFYLDLKGKTLKTTSYIQFKARVTLKSTVAGAVIDCGNFIGDDGSTFLEENVAIVRSSGNIDMGLATYTKSNALWVFSGPSKTVKLGAGQAFYNVICNGSSKVQLLSDVTIDNLYAHINPIDGNGFNLVLTKPENEFTGLRRPLNMPITELRIGTIGLEDTWLKTLGAVL